MLSIKGGEVHCPPSIKIVTQGNFHKISVRWLPGLAISRTKRSGMFRVDTVVVAARIYMSSREKKWKRVQDVGISLARITVDGSMSSCFSVLSH